MRSVGMNAFQIYVVESYSGEWRRYDNARLSGGTEADFTTISRDVLNCADNLCKYQEHYGISLSKSYLASWYGIGGGNLRMEVRGNSTGYKNILEIPEEYIFGFVDKVKQESGGLE